MPTGNLERAKGSSSFKLAAGTADLAPGDSIDTGLDSVDSANLTAEDSNGTIVATVDSTSGGTVTVQHNANGGGTETIHYQAFGA